MTEAELEAKWPQIPWRTPVEIYLTGPNKVKGLGCRFCIAQKGVRGADIPGLPQTQEEFHKHMIECHGGKAAA